MSGGSALQPDLLMYPVVGQSIPIVYDAYDKWSTIAMQAFATAQQLASQLTNVPMSTVAFNAHFNPQLALSPFPTLPKPVTPTNLDFNAPNLPASPPIIKVPILPPSAYVSSLLGALQTAVQTLLGGNPVPAALAAAMRNRAYAETFVEEQRAVAQAYDEIAARGFSEPNGNLNARVREARTDARMKRQQINAEIYIKEQMTVVENLRAAVQLGTQLEGQSVEVYRVTTETTLEVTRAEIEQARLQIDEWRAGVQLYDAQLRAEMTRLDAALKSFQAQVEVYTADAQIATAAGEYDNRRFQLNLAQEQAIVDTEMKRQDQQFEQLRYITSVMVQIKQTLAEVSARLAAAAMSAVNVGASLTHSSSEALDYNLGISYYGQLSPASSSGS